MSGVEPETLTAEERAFYSMAQPGGRLLDLYDAALARAEAAEPDPVEQELLIDELNDALCSLLHTGGETGEHSPRTHLDLFYARAQAAEPPTIEHAQLRDWFSALPEPFRGYVHWLDTNADPSGNIRDATCWKQNALATAEALRECRAELEARDRMLCNAVNHTTVLQAALESTRAELATAREATQAIADRCRALEQATASFEAASEQACKDAGTAETALRELREYVAELHRRYNIPTEVMVSRNV